MKDIIFLLITCDIFILISTQDCREFAEECNDDKACCGGCCINGICKDTYADCRIKSDPCLDHSCPPDQDCYVYEPKDCKGCGQSLQCRNSPPAPPEYFPPTYETPELITNAGKIAKFDAYRLEVLLLISYFYMHCHIKI